MFGKLLFHACLFPDSCDTKHSWTCKICIRSDLNQGSLVSVLVMSMFCQLVSRPKLTILMKSGYMGVVRVPGPKNGDI